MDQEKLKKANELSEEIAAAEKCLRWWTNARKLGNNTKNSVYLSYTNKDGHSACDWVPISENSFSVIKTLNIVHYTEYLESLKKEFSNL